MRVVPGIVVESPSELSGVRHDAQVARHGRAQDSLMSGQYEADILSRGLARHVSTTRGKRVTKLKEFVVTNALRGGADESQ